MLRNLRREENKKIARYRQKKWIINCKTKLLPSYVFESVSRSWPFSSPWRNEGLQFFWERDYHVTKCFPVQLTESLIMCYLETRRLYLLKNNTLELFCMRQRKLTSSHQGKNPMISTLLTTLCNLYSWGRPRSETCTCLSCCFDCEVFLVLRKLTWFCYYSSAQSSLFYALKIYKGESD